MSEAVLEVEGLSKRYDELSAVEDLSFRVGSGEILGLVGPNGAGKTSTLRSLVGILKPSAGQVRIAGHDLGLEPVEARRNLGFVPDEPRLFEYLSVQEHLELSARIYGVDDAERKAAELLEALALADKRDALPHTLSRGMRQKLQVACALLPGPRLLVLDEPLTGLDPIGMRRVKEIIRARAASGVAVVLSSHLLVLVEELCDRVLLLRGGRKLLEGSLQEVRAALPGLKADADLEAVFLRAFEAEGRPEEPPPGAVSGNG